MIFGSRFREGQQLAGRVALVAGASSGIGEACAAALAAAGATVAAVARRAERLDQLVDRITAAGNQAVALPGDVADEAVAKGVVAATIKRFGRIDILVNSAGTMQASNVENADLAEWRRILEVNLLASLHTCHAALGAMKAQGGGAIFNIGSLACRETSPIISELWIRATTDIQY